MVLTKPEIKPHYYGVILNFRMQPMIKRHVECENVQFVVEEYAQALIFMLNTLNLTLVKEASFIDVKYIGRSKTVIMIAFGVIYDNKSNQLINNINLLNNGSGITKHNQVRRLHNTLLAGIQSNKLDNRKTLIQ